MGYYWHDKGFLHDSVHQIPEAAVPLSDEEHAALMSAQAGGYEIVTGSDGRPVAVPPAPLSPEEIQQHIMAAIQDRLDTFARSRGYDNILSAASYATSTNVTYQIEGQYAVQARDDTWAAAYAVLAEVMAGQRPMPAFDEVLAELPPLAWPNADPLRDVEV